MNKLVTYVPVLSTPAGSCLTVQNWQEVGVRVGSYYLEELLQKPGAENFANLTSLAHYLGWQNDLILNASSIQINSHGEFSLRSSYDGTKFKYNIDDLLNFIKLLKPQAVILPHEFYKIASYPQLPDTIKIFSPHPDSPNLYEYNNIFYLETNQPALDACNGIIYTSSQPYNLLDSSMATQFEILDQDCTCPTCKQNLTRAYLHHLFHQVPLLCQRFLIQHNVCRFTF